MRIKAPLVVLVLSAAAAIGVGLSVAGASSKEAPTKGTIPETAFADNGPVDSGQVPDFVETLGPDGKPVGYTKKEDALGLRRPTAEPSLGEPTPVYADDLTTVVGYMHPGIGFVAEGDPVPKPSSPPSTALEPTEPGG
ncbi:MAG: hypothetical protein EKK62_00575 [Acidimicrobiia bacterium]|nr:MAG: hypothetical protein EKK62_00575 [Acidimicrobiia bacterium]HLU30990.1 hypothetical protein [Acidimicrobiia bacterium]